MEKNWRTENLLEVLPSPLIFVPSKTIGRRVVLKSLSTSGRLARRIFAARDELLFKGLKPTVFSDSGTDKCRCF